VADVEMMEGRLSGSDFSLNAQQSWDEDGREWIDVLEDEGSQASEAIEVAHDAELLRGWLANALGVLTARERYIVAERKLREDGKTLEALGEELGLSKERVRQLEAAAFVKMRRSLEGQTRELRHFLA
jgi:RNA polymerase sigma-32 factor